MRLQAVRRRFRAAFAVIAVLLALALIEVAARVGTRVAWYVEHRAAARDLDAARLRFDRDLGWGWDENEQFRGRRNVPVAKPADTFRIVTIGDSCTRGAGAHPAETFTWQLGEMLDADRPPLRVETLNAGVNGYRTAQMADYLARDLLAYRPDLVIVYANPFDESDAAADGAPPAPDTAWYERTDDRGLGVWLRRLLFHSRAYYVMRQVVAGLRDRPVEPPSERARQQSRNLLRIRDLCDSVGAKMLIVEYVVKRFDGTRDVLAVPEINATRAWEAPFVRVYPTMVESGYRPDELFKDAVHPTPRGHYIIAGLLAERIRKLGWIDQEARRRGMR